MGLANYIWFEKHRPKMLKDVSLKKEHRTAFKKYIKDKQIPHLMLEGVHGSGKSTMAYIITNEIPCVTLTLNASGKEDRSIETMQTRVKQFAASQPPKGKIKIVVLEEASGILPQAQESLKDTIERYSERCRFLMTCNHFDKIIGPIQSRCTRFTFDKFPKRKLLSVCNSILEAEGIEDTDQDELTELIKRFYPDMRSIVNNLQSACVAGSFNPKALGSLNADPREIADLIVAGKLMNIRNAVAGITDFMYVYRYLMDEWILDYQPEQQMLISQIIGDSTRYTDRVPDREIEFMNFCAMMMEALEIEPK